MKVEIPQAISMTAKYLKAGLVPMLHGSPGVGKSSIIRLVAEQFNLFVIDIRLSQCDPTDLNGFPRVAGERASYLPMNVWPLKGDTPPINPKTKKPYDGWLIFFDEANAAPLAVQAASYKIMLERMVGQHDLHERAVMAAAGNLETDGAVVEPMSTALQSRLAHIVLDATDTRAFLDWCAETKKDPRISAYINYRPDNLHTLKADHSDMTFACQRTYEFAERVLKATDVHDPDRLPMLCGVLGDGVGMEFHTYCSEFDKLPKMEDIKRDPKGAMVPEEPSTLWALVSAMAHGMVPENAEPLLTYMGRLPMEFQMVCMRDAKKRKPELTRVPAFAKWLMDSAVNLY